MDLLKGDTVQSIVKDAGKMVTFALTVMGATWWVAQNFSTRSDMQVVEEAGGKKVVELRAYVDAKDAAIVDALKDTQLQVVKVQTAMVEEFKNFRQDAREDSREVQKSLNDIYSRLPRRQVEVSLAPADKI